jgi:preprotein translocase subunit SecE
MATEARPGFGQRLAAGVRGIPQGYQDILVEMKKVTWPDRAQTVDATWRIIVFVLAIGLVIFLMDFVLQKLLVEIIPSLFGAR